MTDDISDGSGADPSGTVLEDAPEDAPEGTDPEPGEVDDEPVTRRDKAAARAEEIADGIAESYHWLGQILTVIFLVPVMLVLRRVPKSDKLADRFIERGFELKQELSGCDAFAFAAYGDKAVFPRPANWQSKEQHYATSNGETYSAKGEGHTPYYLFGSIPVIFTLRKSAECFEPIQAYLAQKRALGDWIAEKDENGNQTVLVGAETPNGEDGMVLSWEKAFEMHYQKITQEDLEEQFDIGRLTELNKAMQTKIAFMVIGAFVGGMATLLVIFYIINRFFLGDGGGGGFLLTVAQLGVF